MRVLVRPNIGADLVAISQPISCGRPTNAFLLQQGRPREQLAFWHASSLPRSHRYRYGTPEVREVKRFGHIGRPTICPGRARCSRGRRAIRHARAAGGYEPELVMRQWGLIPWFAKTAKRTFRAIMNIAGSEKLAAKATFRDP